MNIANDRVVKIDGHRYHEGEAVLHGIEVIPELGNKYRCKLEVSGKYIAGRTTKTVPIAMNKECYGGAWKEEVYQAIRDYKANQEEREADKTRELELRLTSQSRELSCDGKRAYRTPEYAEKKCREMSVRTGDTLNYYFCNYCRCYHVGHLPWWVKKIS